MSTPEFPKEKYLEISQKLEIYHGLFNKLWSLGKPRFSNEVDTAAVMFNKEGRCIDFVFNYEFYKTLDNNNIFFVICHELLHVFLEHGFRSQLFKDKDNVNKAMDVVINEMLASSFGFDRNTILNQKEYCWYDTVFNTPVPKDKSFEYYYDLIQRNKKNNQNGNSSKGGEPKTVDSHSGLGEISQEMVDKITQSIEELSPEEKKDLAKKIEKEVGEFIKDQEMQGKNKSSDDTSNKQAGTVAGGIVKYVNYTKIIKKRKWETVIKNWVMRAMKDTEKEEEQFVRKNRRLAFLNSIPEDTFVPSEYEVDGNNKEKHRIRLLLSLDTSGSCAHLGDRFFKAAMSIPNDRFDVTMACFDTVFYKLSKEDIKAKRLKGFGGTSFRIIEDFVAKERNENRGFHAIFVITDGWGDNIHPLNPERYHWFLTESNSKSYIPPKSKIYELKNYE